MKAILGCDEAGEQEEQKFFVFVKHNAIIRIDVKVNEVSYADLVVILNGRPTDLALQLFQQRHYRRLRECFLLFVSFSIS